jgi:sugar/nucleoside kinase (ribokinase family)
VEEDCGREVISALCKNSSIIKASQEDLASIIPGRSAEDAAGYLLDAGARTVVVTCGGGGAFYRQPGRGPIWFRPFQAVSEEEDGRLDFTGAGDSFGGGFMASYLRHRDIDAAMVNGNCTASLMIQRSGGCTFGRMPTTERIARRIGTGE